ncbi:MAG TPA: hypothetical protein VNM36_11040 [Gemmatimonadaceae bacterium]|nr:hypothetical protein [Gemmatimonadaceae bacterium]
MVRALQSIGYWCGLSLTLLIVACQDSAPTAPAVPLPMSASELSGTWTFSDSTVATTPVEQVTCQNRGVANFTAGVENTGVELRLIGTCLTPRGPGGRQITMEASRVIMLGDSITFAVSGGQGVQAETCTYRGRLTGAHSLAASGAVSCSLRGPGSWEMTWGLARGPQLDKFTSIDIAFGYTCALDGGGQAWCWGDNSYGNLGTDDAVPRLVPAPVAGNVRFAKLSLAREGTVACALTAAGEAWCWGSSWGGVLGDGAGAQAGRPVMKPQRVVGDLTFSQIASAGSHTCAITTAGKAYCWGMNALGQLGTGNETPSSSPVAVSGGLTFKQIDTYTLVTCGVTANGRAYCWGEGWSGILGNGDTSDSNSPAAVAGDLTFESVSVGAWMACGVTTAGDGYCWGTGGNGLGTGSDVGESSTPVLVAGGLKWKSISAGSFIACGVTTTSVGYCWGDNFQGTLGTGPSLLNGSNRPVAIAGSLLVDQVVVDWHGCALTVAGIAYCWGTGDHGEIGDGDLRTRWVPVKVAGQR